MNRLSGPMIALCLVVPSLAAAQDGGLDAHNFPVVPSDGDPMDPVATFRGERQVPGSWAAGGTFEFVDAPLVLIEEDLAGNQTETPLLDNVFGLTLGVHYAAHERLALGVTAPVWLLSAGESGGNGPAMGDLRVYAPAGVVLPREDGTGPSFSVIPFLRIPTGKDAAWLGDAGFGAGALLAAGYANPKLSFDANFGMISGAELDTLNLEGGPRLLASLSAGYAVSPKVGARAELRYEPSLSKNVQRGAESPAEVLVDARGKLNDQLGLVGGVAKGISSGAGAANFRVFAGATYTFGKGPEKPKDTDGDGLLDLVDACPEVPETKNDWKDDDGCPDALNETKVLVVAEGGEKLAAAEVTVDGAVVGETGADGSLALAARTPEGEIAVDARHPSGGDVAPAKVALVEGPQTVTVTLPLLPSRVEVTVKTPEGAPIPAVVKFRGPGDVADLPLGEDGFEGFPLARGAWTIVVAAEGFGNASQKIELLPGETEKLEFVLVPPKVEVAEEEIYILEKVFFDYNLDTVKAESLPLLKEVASVLLANPRILKIEVQGHTDHDGSDEFNLDLSQRRVETVRRYLIDQGVDGDRLVAKGYGESRPIASNDTEAGMAANRRVQFVILEQVTSKEYEERKKGGAE